MEAQYVLVYWREDKKNSILTDEFVLDKRILVDAKLEGLVAHGVIGKKPPKPDWKQYTAQVVATAGKHNFKSII